MLAQVADQDAQLIGLVLGSANWKPLVSSEKGITVAREVHVEHGNNDRAGRLDLIVSDESGTLAVIEVKTRPYDGSDLEKHRGYRDSIIVDSPKTDLIFLSVDPPELEPGGFRFLSWADVCVTLRAIAPRLLKSGNILGTALILAFVGSVEQNLLGFKAPEATLLPVGKVPRMVDHLIKAERMGVSLGDP